MFEKISDTGEAIVAVAAAVGLRSGMRQEMSDQIISADKRFIAFITLVGLRVGVQLLVRAELILAGKTGTTVVAHVTLLVHMVEHVRIHRRLSRVHRAALAAFESLHRATLGLRVNFELGPRFELLAALGTHVVLAVASFMLLPEVLLVVFLQGELGLTDAAPEDAVLVALVLVPVPLGGERALAQGANEPSRWIVPFRVAQEVGFVEENLVANIASIVDSIQIVIEDRSGFPRCRSLLGFQRATAFSFRRNLLVGAHFYLACRSLF